MFNESITLHYGKKYKNEPIKEVVSGDLRYALWIASLPAYAKNHPDNHNALLTAIAEELDARLQTRG